MNQHELASYFTSGPTHPIRIWSDFWCAYRGQDPLQRLRSIQRINTCSDLAKPYLPPNLALWLSPDNDAGCWTLFREHYTTNADHTTLIVSWLSDIFWTIHNAHPR